MKTKPIEISGATQSILLYSVGVDIKYNLFYVISISIKMTTRIADISPQKAARVAGILYLMVIVFGMFSLMYVPSSLIVPGDAATTANNIMASETLFRIGYVGQLLMLMSFLLLPLPLYKLLKPVNKNLASLMVLFVIVSIPIQMLNSLNYFAALPLLTDASYSSVFTADQLRAQAMMSLNLYEYGYLIADIFFGLWLIPLGLLVYKSGYFPRVLGATSMIAGIGLLIKLFTIFLFPSTEGIIITVLEATGFLELIFPAWLLLKGAKVPQP